MFLSQAHNRTIFPTEGTIEASLFTEEPRTFWGPKAVLTSLCILPPAGGFVVNLKKKKKKNPISFNLYIPGLFQKKIDW